MQCKYCDSHIHPIPTNGLCPNCGAALPAPAPAPAQQPQVKPPTQTVMYAQSGIHYCPRCYSQNIRFKKRGFRWGTALLGLFFLPPFGMLFGLIGKNDLRYRCDTCSYRWKR